jgi:transcriptional regulator of acetoin/glycerol metabolism
LAQQERRTTIAVDMNHVLPTSLLDSRPARVAMARQRFFEEGIAPAGAVGEAVFESWARCLRTLGSPQHPAEFQPVTASRTQLVLQKNRQLLQAWREELPGLEAVLGTTTCSAMLTDAKGVIIAAACVGRPHEALMPVATRLGVNLSEDAVGTTAPGVAARTGKAVCVLGAEHFFDNVQQMHCAAAPIRDVHGGLAGVLDISSEQIPFAYDAAAVVGLYAGAIENRLLVAQASEHLVVRFQLAPDLLDSAMTGLVGIDDRGRVVWENAVAKRLLGAWRAQGVSANCEPEQRLGTRWSTLASLPATGAAPLVLPSGLRVWARADMRAPDGRRRLMVGAVPLRACTASLDTEPFSGSVPSTASPAESGLHMPAARMRDFDLALIERALSACGGNVTEAARRLGVSRGLIYRRRRAAAGPSQVRSASAPLQCSQTERPPPHVNPILGQQEPTA